ncbi:hypothetical protein PHLCEN_2v2315 [Hermanssonia centrifuga]|uniref:Uncharacterized protein n=1 Tax=Hermanssonia centrifuga TaxID=98765 RepID=A0A2R6RPE1_9APHY|nr:hypothetical protein PHLCEN_2v2315 [Hermanssonia centrifuga]
MLATAADLPPELFKGVIHALVDDYEHTPRCKREFGLASLTCRYFAEQCRPEIFYQIRLESREDVLTLISFLGSSISRIKDYIDKIVVTQYEPCEPWLHLLHTSLMYRIPHAEIEYFKLTAKTSSPTAVKLQSLHTGPPTSTPPACWNIKRLYLVKLQLNSFSYLVKLVAGLPQLELLFCERLTWPSLPPDSLPDLRRYSHKNQRMGEVSMKGCEEHWPMLWFNPKIAQIDRGDVRIMSRLGRCIENLNRPGVGEMTGYLRSHVFFRKGKLDVRTIFIGSKCWYQGPDLVLSFNNEQPKSLVKLRIIFHGCVGASIQCINWQEFDEQASCLRNLGAAEFCFEKRQSLAFVRSMAEIIPRLTRLRNADKLRATYQERCGKPTSNVDINDLERNLVALGGIKQEPSTPKPALETESVPPDTDATDLQMDTTRVNEEV